jgi:hypothetical protein
MTDVRSSPRRAGLAVAALFVLSWTGAAGAQDNSVAAALKRLELPAHQRLMRLIETPGTSLAPFATDGCSGGMSAAWSLTDRLFPNLETGPSPPWESCCITHDRAYHDAGVARTADESYDARLAADTGLRSCVLEFGLANLDKLAVRYATSEEEIRQGYEVLSSAMFDAVRLGGAPCSGLSWRWGYGYPNCPW